MPDVLGTKIGRPVAAEFADPARLSSLGVNRLIRFAAIRDVQLRRPVAERVVTAAKEALPTGVGAAVRRVLAPIWGCCPIWTPRSRTPPSANSDIVAAQSLRKR